MLGREIGGRTPQTTLELCEVLLDVAKVAIVPGEAFGAPGYARLSFALGDDDLGEGVRRIADRCSIVSGRRRLALPMADRVLVAEPLAERGLDAMRAAGLEVDVQTGLSPEELLAALPGVARARDPQRDAGHGRGARGRRPISSSSAGPASGSTTSTSPRRRAAA